MTEEDLNELMPQMETFHKRFHPFFCRSEGRSWSRKYLIGLLLPIDRKNVENIAEEVGAPPRKLQEFVVAWTYQIHGISFLDLFL